jgi:hypothetical protein
MVEGCERLHSAKNYCTVHYRRWSRTGNARDSKILTRLPVSGICSVETCEKEVRCAGMCNAHYLRKQKGNDMSKPIRERAANGAGSRWINNNGYVVLTLPGQKGRKMEHRLVMENILGRKLRSNENVHHINGVKNDNRPENLELWIKSQPAGQRIKDIVKWAKEILQVYDPQSLNANKHINTK